MTDNQQPNLAFKPLKEDENYLIYSNGDLYSKKVNRFLKGKIDNVGYKTYALALQERRSKSGKKLSKMVYAHRLVAEYFLDNPNNYDIVHHKDGNRLNNNVENLEWTNVKEHNQHHNVNSSRKVTPKYFEKNLSGEQWKVFPLNNLYEVSSYGRVRNIKTNRLLKIDDFQKYQRVSLNDKKHYYLHRMVYCTFNNDFNLEGFVIDHIDNNPKNNKLDNLQKITQQENCLKQDRFND